MGLPGAFTGPEGLAKYPPFDWKAAARAHWGWVAGAAAVTGLAVLSIVWTILIHDVLPHVLQTRLSAALQREVTFRSVNPNLLSSFSVYDFKMSRGRTFKEGILVAAKEAGVRYKLWPLLHHPTQWQAAIRRVELIEPYLALDVSAFQGAEGRRHPSVRATPARGRVVVPAPPAIRPATELPPLPRTFMTIKGGTFVLTRGETTIAEIRKLMADLDLRDLPRIEGHLKFTLAPEAVVSANGACHLGLKNFSASLEIERLDLGQLSGIARQVDLKMPVAVGGFLDANVELQGGFMTVKELVTQTSGHGRLKLAEGSLALASSPLVTGLEAEGELEGRRITLDRLVGRVLSGSLSAAGSLNNLGLGALRLNGALEKVPVAALRALSPGLPDTLTGEFSFQFSATGTGTAPVFAGRLTAPLFGVPGARAEQVVAEAVYTLDEARLTDLHARLWDGRFSGQGWVGGLRTRKAALNFTASGTGFSLARTLLGTRYAGEAALAATLEGPLKALRGEAHAKLTKVVAMGYPADDVQVDARFQGGAVALDARTAKGAVVATGTLELEGGVRCVGCKVAVQERLVQILALAGVKPPEGLDGRASATLQFEGPLTDPEVTAEGVASNVRLGKTSYGDLVRIPRFVFHKARMEFPADQPVEIVWEPEATRLTASGVVPLTVFGTGSQEAFALHVEVPEGKLGVLRRLGLARVADGKFRLLMDVGGTTAYPVFKHVELNGSGKRIELMDKLFAKGIDHWSLDLKMDDNEGLVRMLVAPTRKDRQELEGRFNLAGWSLGAVDLSTTTIGEHGLPLLIEDMADVHCWLTGHIAKDAGEESVTIAGPNPLRGAELRLANGAITYAGESPPPKPKPGEAPAGPSAFSRWAKRSLNFVGTIAFGKNVSYRPKDFGQIGIDLLKNIKKLFRKGGAEEASRTFRDLAEGALIGFDVKVREGSELMFLKEGEREDAKGELVLDPGGKMTLFGREFFLVDVPGHRQVIEFPGNGDLAPTVNVIGEATLYDVHLLTESGERALVDEMRVRLIVSPPAGSDLVQEPTEREQRKFLRYSMRLAADPEVVSGEVEAAPAPVAAPAPGAAAGGQAADAGAATAGTPSPAGGPPAAGPVAAPVAVARTVTIRPSQSALMGALTGLDALGSAGGSFLGSVAGVVFSALTAPLKLALEAVGIPLDVLSIRQSGQRHQAGSQGTGAQASGTGAAGGLGATASAAASAALSNTEVTVGKTIGKNFYVNWKTILLDASSLMTRGATSAELSTQQSSAWGSMLEMEYRKDWIKLKGKGRFFPLPNDPDPTKKYEFFGGVEISQPFGGIGRKEPFVW